MEEVFIWGHDNSFVSFDDEVDGVEDEDFEVPWDIGRRAVVKVSWSRNLYVWSGGHELRLALLWPKSLIQYF